MKKRINSRSKGNRFENQCCQLLEKVTNYTFRRTRGSGAGPLKGDIAPYSEKQEETLKWIQNFPLTIECKNNEYAELHHLLISPETSFLWKSWLQAVEGSVRTGKIPLLMFTKNHYPIMCMMKWENLGTLTNLFHESKNYKFNYEDEETIEFPYFLWKRKEGDTYILWEWESIK